MCFQYSNWILSPPITPDYQQMANLCENPSNDEDNNQQQLFREIEAKKLISSLKTTAVGTKLIRIEIYNADQFASTGESTCKCNADICAQHVVRNVHLDQIYPRIREILKCMDNKIYMNL